MKRDIPNEKMKKKKKKEKFTKIIDPMKSQVKYLGERPCLNAIYKSVV